MVVWRAQGHVGPRVSPGGSGVLVEAPRVDEVGSGLIEVLRREEVFVDATTGTEVDPVKDQGNSTVGAGGLCHLAPTNDSGTVLTDNLLPDNLLPDEEEDDEAVSDEESDEESVEESDKESIEESDKESVKESDEESVEESNEESVEESDEEEVDEEDRCECCRTDLGRGSGGYGECSGCGTRWLYEYGVRKWDWRHCPYGRRWH